MYRQSLPGHDLSIEQGTAAVPADGFFYVLHRGASEGRFRTLAQARRCYLKIKESLAPLPSSSPAARPSFGELRRREMEAQSNKALIWADEDFARVARKTQGRPRH